MRRGGGDLDLFICHGVFSTRDWHRRLLDASSGVMRVLILHADLHFLCFLHFRLQVAE